MQTTKIKAAKITKPTQKFQQNLQNLQTPQIQPPQQIQPTINYRTAKDYQKLTPIQHAYMRADTYLGCDERLERMEWLYNFETKRMYSQLIDFNPACIRLFEEILSNASDNCNHSRREGVDPGTIEITMDSTTVTVKNYGLPIPVDIHPVEKIYVPQMIFGELLSGANFDEMETHGIKSKAKKERLDNGTNGIGAKAVNIYSHEFELDIYNHIAHLRYQQHWSKNMTICDEPIITPYDGDISSVSVSYKMDFERFGYDSKIGYSPEIFQLYARQAINVSSTAKVPVVFNGEQFNYSNIREHARLYFGDAVETGIVHYQWPKEAVVIYRTDGEQIDKTKYLPLVEMIVMDTPDEGHHVSSVNCMATNDGGVHLNAAIKAVSENVVELVNTKNEKDNKNSKNAVDKLPTVTINDVKPHISILLSVQLVNPKYTSQAKTACKAPVPKISIPKDALSVITDKKSAHQWSLMDRLFATLKAKETYNLPKAEKAKAFLKLKKGEDANNAGKKGWENTILYLTEGDSGKTYAEKLAELTPGGRDNIGIYPMRGKSKNETHNCQTETKNKEFKELSQMLGLTPRMNYSSDENFATLRYGAVMIMADADRDGWHIVSLIVNFFHCRYPSLLERGYLLNYETPIVRVTSPSGVHLKFFTDEEYQEWRVVTPEYKKWEHFYLKGLGGSKDEYIEDDYHDPRVVKLHYDEGTPDALEKAFSKDCSNQRKTWITNFQPTKLITENNTQNISEYINCRLVLYSIASLTRAIPKMDSFKEAHRKIMHGTHTKWDIGSNKKHEKFKVGRFGDYVAELTCYQHAETTLEDVITGMTHDFPGANNIPWFEKEGQFGTRYEGGKDCSDGRYIYVRPSKLLQYIHRKEDQGLLNYLEDEGESIEPAIYYQVIPMILANGQRGIATGFRCDIAPYNPRVLVKWLRMRLRGASPEELPFLTPWYRGFTGTNVIIDRSLKRNGKKRAKKTANDEEDEKEDLEQESKYSLKSQGCFHADTKGTIYVTELPIGLWPIKYKAQLDEWVENKTIKRYNSNSIRDRIYFEIFGFKGKPTYESLKLQSSSPLNLINILGEDGLPIRYNTANDLMEAFFSSRLPIYLKRKEMQLSNQKAEIDKAELKLKFNRFVIANPDLITGRDETEINDWLEQNGFPKTFLKGSIGSFSPKGVTNLEEKIKSLYNGLEAIEKISKEEMYLKDLDEFQDAYDQIYGKTDEVVKQHVEKSSTNHARPLGLNLNGEIAAVVKPTRGTGRGGSRARGITRVSKATSTTRAVAKTRGSSKATRGAARGTRGRK
jgi:DNA topoisomerase-2